MPLPSNRNVHCHRCNINIPHHVQCSFFCQQPSGVLHRLIHSPCPVPIGVPGKFETSLPIGWYCDCTVGVFLPLLNYRYAAMHHGLAWYKFTLFFGPITVPFHSPNGKQMPAAVRAVHGDREIVFLPDTLANMMDGQTWKITRDLVLRHPTLKWCKSMVFFPL